MILVYVLAAMLGLLVYLFTFRFDTKRRVMFSLLAFAVPAAIMTVLAVAAGD